MKCKCKVDSNERRHNDRVLELEKTLTKKGFDCFTFLDYQVEDIQGEIDLFAIRDTLPPLYRFYEVKCHDCHNRRKKAKEQYERYLYAHQLKRSEVEGYMVSYDGPTRRL